MSFNDGQKLRISRDTAVALDDTAAAEKYGALFETVQAAFHKVYFNSKTSMYGDGTQAAQVYAL